MRIFGLFLFLATTAWLHAALADEPFPKTGEAKLAAYSVCRSLAIVDMGRPARTPRPSAPAS